MKTVLVLLPLIAVAVSWNVPQPIRTRWIHDASPHYSKCICSSGAEMTAAENILGKLEYPNNPCLKCFLKCVEVEMGLMLTDGTIVPEAWVRVVAGVTPEIAEKCTNDTNNILDSCQKAYDWSQCLVEAVSIN